MMGHIIEWYYNGIAGIKAETPGFTEVTIRPYLPEGMNRFSCTYESAAGPISVAVGRSGGDIRLEVRVSKKISYREPSDNAPEIGRLCF
jgi:alpha-L-rhamnosidase